MSYQLVFWKENTKLPLDTYSIYERLLNDEHINGVATLPSADIASALEAVFNDGWMRERETPRFWEHPERERGVFDLNIGDQCFYVLCYGMSGEDMNRFIDVGLMFGCPLYDPQVDRRFVDA